MSVSSNGSQLSVSYFGEEKSFDDMCDECFRDLQTHLNDIHGKVRELAMCEDQDNDFLVALDYHLQIKDGIEGISELLKELANVSKQVLGKPPVQLKEQVKTIVDNHKLQRKMASTTLNKIKE